MNTKTVKTSKAQAMTTQHPEYVSKAELVIHYRQTIEEVAQRRGIHKSCLDVDKPYPLCGNGSYHARTARNVAAVTCPCCLERLCSPSEQRKCKDGDRNPNSRENWIECQARALGQAARHITAAQIGV